ncbi:MAG: hypothetical protein AABZ53_13620 [Planctomycetota bacterium]
MMPSEQRALRLSYVAALALPLMTVGGVRTAWLAQGPAKAGATQVKSAERKGGSQENDKAPPPVARRPQDDLARAITATLTNPLGPCPLFVPEIHRTAAPPSPSDIPGIPMVAVADFRLTSIATGGRELMAVIDGRVRRIGDEVREGWKVESIDRVAQTVTFSGPLGRSTVARLRPDDKR